MPGSESELPWIRVILQTLVSPLCIRPMQPKRLGEERGIPMKRSVCHPAPAITLQSSQEQLTDHGWGSAAWRSCHEVCGEVHYETQRGNAAW